MAGILQTSEPARDGGRWRVVLLLSAPLLLAAAGLVLWRERAAAVFLDSISAALSWCL